MIRPALRSSQGGEAIELDEALVDSLDHALGQTVPTMPILRATARRLRRVYLYLFLAQWLAWILKLASHPAPAASVSEVIARAGIAGVPGSVCFGGSLVGLGAAVAMAFAIGGIERRQDNELQTG
jgi:uncharacterized membrane protein